MSHDIRDFCWRSTLHLPLACQHGPPLGLRPNLVLEYWHAIMQPSHPDDMQFVIDEVGWQNGFCGARSAESCVMFSNRKRPLTPHRPLKASSHQTKRQGPPQDRRHLMNHHQDPHDALEARSMFLQLLRFWRPIATHQQLDDRRTPVLSYSGCWHYSYSLGLSLRYVRERALLLKSAGSYDMERAL